MITDDAVMASSVLEGWELEVSRRRRRLLAFALPVLLAVTVLAFAVVAFARGEWVALGGLFGLGSVLFFFSGWSAAFWYGTRPGSGSALLSPISVIPRADYDAAAARMRRGEPGETPEEAQIQLTVAERIRHRWWSSAAWLLVGLIYIPDATGHGLGVGRWLSATMVFMSLALAASSERTRRRALRSIGTIQRRWGAIGPIPPLGGSSA